MTDEGSNAGADPALDEGTAALADQAGSPSESVAPPTDQAAPLAENAPPVSGLVDDAGPKPVDFPDDAKDTRGAHLRTLLGNVWVLGIMIVLAGAAFIFTARELGAGPGAGAAGVSILAVLLVVWLIARSRAEDDFYDAYAAGRGLTRVAGRSSLPPVTPLLRKGDRRYAQRMFNGTLPGGLAGSLAHYTYEDESRDSDGNTETTYYHFTLVVSQLPETAPFLSELALQRRAGFRFLDGAEDAFRKRQRVELESVAADKKFEIFTGERDDLNRARQVFTPSFIVWLAEDAHEGMAFELVAGTFVANIKGHKKTAHELDEFCQGAAIMARRCHEEATE